MKDLYNLQRMPYSEVTFSASTKNNLVNFKTGQHTHIFVINTLHKNKFSVGSFSMGLVLKWSA